MRDPREHRRVIGLAALIGVVLTVTCFELASAHWRALELPQDEAYYIQGFYHAAQGHGWFPQTIFLPYSAILQIHLNLIDFLIFPLYLLWKSPLLLFLITDLAVAACGVALFLIARRVFASVALAVIWAGVFAAYSSIVYLAGVGFRDTALVMAFVSLALLFYLEDRKRPFLAMLALAMLCKEDVALLLPTWGMVAWLQGKSRRLALVLVTFGIAYFAVANTLVLPLIRGGHPGQVYLTGFASPLGGSPGAILKGILERPGEGLRLLLSPHYLSFLGALVNPLLFLPLAGSEYLVIPAAYFVEIALVPAFQFVNLHYQAPIIPFLFVAAMVGMQRVAAFGERVIMVLHWGRRLRRRILVSGLLGFICMSSLFHTAWQTQVFTLWPFDARDASREMFFRDLEALPPRSSVVATASLAAPVAAYTDVLWLDHAPYALSWMGYGMDILALDRADAYEDRKIFDRQVAWLLCQRAYGVLAVDHSFGHTRLLLARGANPASNRLTLYQIMYGTHIYEAAQIPTGPALPRLPWFYRLVHRGGINAFDPAASTRWARVGRPGFPHPSADVLVAGPDGRAAEGSDAEIARVLPGRYRVDFYLKVDHIRQEAPIATVSVVSRSDGRVLQERELRGRDFGRPGQYRPFSLLVTVGHPTAIEFRVRYLLRDVTLWVDRIELRQLEPSFDPSTVCDERGAAAAPAAASGNPQPKHAGIAAPSATSCRPEGVSSRSPVTGEGMLTLSGGGHDFGVASGLQPRHLGRLSALTLEAWIHPSSDGPGHRLPVFWSNGAEGYELDVIPEPGTLVLSAGGRRDLLTARLPLDRWSHIAARFVGRTARLYVNGMPGAVGQLGHDITAGIFPLFLGYRPVGPNGYIDGRPDVETRMDVAWFKGSMTGVRIWGRAIGEEELRSRMRRRLTGRQEGLLADWRFDAMRSDLAVPDRSGGHHDLLLGTACAVVSPLVESARATSALRRGGINISPLKYAFFNQGFDIVGAGIGAARDQVFLSPLRWLEMNDK